MKKITIEEFAKRCGMILIKDDSSEWSGKWGHTTENSNVSIVGFKTKKEAIQGWINSHFGGEHFGKEICNLIDEVNRLNELVKGQKK